jgi:outer membrane lipoprotein-sorting protein
VTVKRIFSASILTAGFFALLTPLPAQQIHDGQSLLTAMHHRYASSWYENVIFKENAITLNSDGTTSTEVWDEALVMPGKLRIDRGAHSAGNGFVFSDGTITRFKDGQPIGPTPFVHMLLVLGFDVYRQSVESTVAICKSQGYDLSQIHEDTWEGQPVYVVGAAKGDSQSKQFWVEKKRLLFVRLLAPDAQDSSKIADTRFRDYKKLAGGWLSERVEFYVDGKNTFNEDYFDVKANTKIDPALFDPARYAQSSLNSVFGK